MAVGGASPSRAALAGGMSDRLVIGALLRLDES